jgi:hypothetical protein
VAFSLVRHNERNETYLCDPRLDKETVDQLGRRCDTYGTTLTISGDQLIVRTKAGRAFGAGRSPRARPRDRPRPGRAEPRRP